MDANYLICLFEPSSDYIWLFSDDDYIVHGSLDDIYDSLNATNPSFCSISFVQRPFSFVNHRYKSFTSPTLVDDPYSYPKLVSTKLSSCIFKRELLHSARIKGADYIGTLWSYVPFIFSNLLIEPKFLIYPKPSAYSTHGSNANSHIRYDPVAFTALFDIIRGCYSIYGKVHIFDRSGYKKLSPVISGFSMYLKFIRSEVSFDNSVIKRLKSRLFNPISVLKLLFNPHLYSLLFHHFKKTK